MQPLVVIATHNIVVHVEPYKSSHKCEHYIVYYSVVSVASQLAPVDIGNLLPMFRLFYPDEALC